MALLLLLPVALSFLLMAAHFLRAGYFPLVCLSLIVPCLLLIRRRRAARTVQLALICGALEWVRTIISIWHERVALGEPYIRMVLFLGAVAVLTLGSVFIMQSPVLRDRYGLNR